MKRRFFPLLVLGALVLSSPLIRAQELDGSDVERELVERDQRILKLSLEDQLKIRAAQVKAMEDPVVKEALAKRDEAIRQFRNTVRASMLKADPGIAPILEKVFIAGPRGTGTPEPQP